MSELFQTDRTAILRHINNIYKNQELESESTCAKNRTSSNRGKRINTNNQREFKR